VYCNCLSFLWGDFIIQIIQILGPLYGIYQFFKDSRKKKHCRVSRLTALDLIHNNKQNQIKGSENAPKENSKINEALRLEWSEIPHKDPDCLEKNIT